MNQMNDMFKTLSAPPAEEPARQRFYIEKMRTYADEAAVRLGRKLRFCVQTFGCQMNARDSEKLAGILSEAGFVPAEEEAADFVIYNTCTVRDNANQRIYGRLGYLHTLKKKNPEMIVALCGCMMQEASVIEKIKQSYGFVDIIFGTHNIYKLAELFDNYISSGRNRIIDIWQETDRIVEELPVQRKYPFKSGVNIMFGCNNFCSYCIVPYVRGRERSRKHEDILREIAHLAADGVKEVMLLGQNVNSYGAGLESEIRFPQLLKEVEKIDGIERIRFMTSHPKDLSEELIETIANSEKICRHIHLPLQSGSSRILKQMNRKYTKESYLALAERIKKSIPDVALTTDIIIGFPGEMEEDFLETMDVVEKVSFSNAFTFLYSKRTGTPAAAMPDQIGEDVMHNRFDRLLALVHETAKAENKKLEGRVLPVLVEEINRQDERLVTGRLSNNAVVHFPGETSLIGSIRNVKLKESKGFYYIGELQ